MLFTEQPPLCRVHGAASRRSCKKSREIPRGWKRKKKRIERQGVPLMKRLINFSGSVCIRGRPAERTHTRTHTRSRALFSYTDSSPRLYLAPELAMPREANSFSKVLECIVSRRASFLHFSRTRVDPQPVFRSSSCIYLSPTLLPRYNTAGYTSLEQATLLHSIGQCYADGIAR